MSSAYGNLNEGNKKQLEKLKEFLPLQFTLKDGTQCCLNLIAEDDSAAFNSIHNLLNLIIEEGKTYPQEYQLSHEAFKNYFQPAFILKGKDDKVLGAFYVKPNYPGRCGHTCNGGFIVEPDERNKGVGKILGMAFLKLAPLMGFTQSIFNLVFENNEASVRLWRSLGFQEVGKIPKAGRLKGYDSERIDAIVFYKAFTS